MKKSDKAIFQQAVKDVEGEVRWQEPMSRHTTLKIGGPADVLVVPLNIHALGRLARQAFELNLPVFVLGGSNLLVRDGGIRGIVVKLSHFQEIKDLGRGGISAEGGVLLSRLARYALSQGLSGFEFALGIPGTVGGAVVMNAGTPEAEMSDVLEDVQIMESNGRVRDVIRKQMSFAYRSSRLPRGVVVRARLKLHPAGRAKIEGRMKTFLERRKRTQPLTLPNAGSVFKNPNGSFAAKLVEAVGLKGHRIGDAQVSGQHANFIVNRGKATAREVLRLIRTIGKRVEDEKGITLELELRIVGRDV